ncbi:MAG: tetratricopeptide repeat protein [Bacteroidetes bacterium]|nr:tetratricopeptide repeat protein [Bacteroidota bacterium]
MNKPVRILFLFLLLHVTAFSQENAAVTDTLKNALRKATTPEEKVKYLDKLSKVMMNVNPAEAEDYGKQLITVAEESRDRKLMFKAYLSNGDRCAFFVNQKKYSDRAIEFMNKALALARQNRMDKKTGEAQLHLAGIYLAIPDNEKALSYATQAFSLISTLSDDSLRVEAHNVYGRVYMARNENTLALRNFLSGLRLAEETGNHSLICNCYGSLAGFYSSIDDYDRAIDYMDKAYKQLDFIQEGNVPYQRVIYINAIGNLYAQKKNYDIAISYFERSIRMADSLKFSTLKVPGYVSLLNQYLRLDEPQKALDYLNSDQGTALKKYLFNFGMASVIDQAYGVIYTELGRFDSARIYLEKAKPVFENSSNENTKVGFYGQLASFYRKSGDKKMAIDYYQKVIEASTRNGLLENVKKSAQYLDTLYMETGNFTLSGQYKAQYYRYKDSIETLKREKELTQVEAEDEEQRQAKAIKDAEELKKRRNNIQYLGIVIGIIGLFVGLVILGMFKVSAGVIKATGFFVFLMLFEFIFLVFKKTIYSFTHGEPLRDLAFMIALAALLVPLHHWLEHKVLHYLTSHNRLTSAGSHIRNKLWRRTKDTEL